VTPGRLLAAILAASLALAPRLAAADDPPPLDPDISAAIATISAAQLRATDQRLVAFGTRSTLSTTDQRPGRGVVAAREWIAAQFRQIAAGSDGRMTVTIDRYTQAADKDKRVDVPTEVGSIIATLPGTEPGGRTVVISSHYDSRVTDVMDRVHDAPGADDNGSGTSLVLAAARALAPTAPRATIVFAVFDGEEQGLLGSAHYAVMLKAAGTPVEADLNNDIVGASVGDDGVRRADQVRIFSEAIPAGANIARLNAIGAENDSPSRELARFTKLTGDAYVTTLHGDLVFRADRFLRGGDHESFNANGFAAVRFTEPVETFAHEHQDVRVEGGVQYGDLLQFVDFDYLANVARYNTAVLASLAFAPGTPKAEIVTSGLTNETTLRWAAVPGAERYEVVRRGSTEAQWSAVTDAGAALTLTLPFSKDVWQFGVRAIDAGGHASPAAYPTPAR
jgi:hypothetical protein